MADKTYQAKQSQTADAEKQYKHIQTNSGLFALTNAFMFTRNNGADDNSQITIGVDGDDFTIDYRHDVEGLILPDGRRTNHFVPAYPHICIGALNGRETSGRLNSRADLKGLERQYNYPAMDLDKAHSRVGLPTFVRDITALRVQATFKSSLYGHSAFSDMYLHDPTMPGHLDGQTGRNATNGTYTKRWNLCVWHQTPKQKNANGLANGWTGAVPLGVRTIGGAVCDIGIKIERGGANEFVYICVVPREQPKKIDYDLAAVIRWAQSDLWDMIAGNPMFVTMLRGMKNPPTHGPTGGLVLCSVGIGSEIWWSKKGKTTKIEFKDVAITVGDKVHKPTGITSVAEPTECPKPPKRKRKGKKAAPDTPETAPDDDNASGSADSEPPPKSGPGSEPDGASDDRWTWTPDVVLTDGDENRVSIPESVGHLHHVDSMGNNPETVCKVVSKNQADGKPAIVLQAVGVGETVITWLTDSGDYKTRVRVV